MNCEMILRAAGVDLNDVVEVGVLLARLPDLLVSIKMTAVLAS